MDIEKMHDLLCGTGLPVAYNAFTEKEVAEKDIKLPFICYRNDFDENMPADNSVYFSNHHFVIELYEKYKSKDTEGLLENVLREYYYTKTESYINDEACYMITYEV